MKKLDFKTKKDLERILIDFMENRNEEIAIKPADKHYRFYISYNRGKYSVGYIQQELQFATVFDLAVYVFAKCDLPLDEFKEVMSKSPKCEESGNNATRGTKTRLKVVTDVDLDIETPRTTNNKRYNKRK